VTNVTPAGLYESIVVFGDQVFVAGMTPKADNVLVKTGRVGAEITRNEARELARLAAARASSAVRERTGSLANVVPLSMTVFICTTPEFAELSAVADGATEAIAEWSGGLLPVRAAVGVQSLPNGAPVEVSLVVGVKR